MSRHPCAATFTFRGPSRSTRRCVGSRPRRPCSFVNLILRRSGKGNAIGIRRHGCFGTKRIIRYLAPTKSMFPIAVKRLAGGSNRRSTTTPRPLRRLAVIARRSLPPCAVLQEHAYKWRDLCEGHTKQYRLHRSCRKEV